MGPNSTTVGPGGPTGDAERFFMCNGKRIEIRDVWADTLEAEMDTIRGLLDRYKFIAMDTEFPGVVARPLAHSAVPVQDYHYQTLRCNVNLLKIIQLGLTFCDEDGQIADGCPCWQFNFKFSLEEDLYAHDSIDLLHRSGIAFPAHQERGVDVSSFAELLISSGIVLNEDVRWISFHSGYDFGYLLKVLTASPLPEAEPAFARLLQTYFPCVYDVKYLALVSEDLRGGLQKMAEDLGVERVGPQHQAGSDSLLTAAVFFKMRSAFFGGKAPPDAAYKGVLYGIGAGGAPGYMREGGGATPSSAAAAAAGGGAVAAGGPGAT